MNPISNRLLDKVAIVTGAGGGIGRAIVHRFLSEGARVILADIERTTPFPDEGSGRALSVTCDVKDESAVEGCVRMALVRYGSLDIIVNNAGAMKFRPLADWTRGEWLEILEVDLLGPAYFIKQAFRHMKDGGSIVNISSVHAMRTSPNVAPYAAAKAALLSLTRSAAIEGRARGIRANALVPGAIDTPMLRENPNIKSGAESLDARDVGTPRDIADAALFLASEEARFITGTSLVVDGGRLVRL